MVKLLHRYGTDKPIPWGAEHRIMMDSIYPYLAGLTVVTEDLPREENCVSLNPELVNNDGIPAPKISYRIDENTRRMFAHAEKRAGEVLLAAGAQKIISKGGNVWRRAGWAPPEWEITRATRWLTHGAAAMM